MTFADAKQRFSGRVSDDVRYRPGYPSDGLPWLRLEGGRKPGHAVADQGSDTGGPERTLPEERQWRVRRHAQPGPAPGGRRMSRVLGQLQEHGRLGRGHHARRLQYATLADYGRLEHQG